MNGNEFVSARMNKNTAIRTALIGCGDIAETGHLPALLEHPRFTLTAVCDVRDKRAELLGARAGNVEKLNDYRSLLERADIGAVILALHPEHSVDIAIDFLQHGKAVLDEKPLAVSLAEGNRLAGVVAESSAPYQIGFVFRYCEMVCRIAEFANRIGGPAVLSVGIFDELLDPENTEHYNRMQQILRSSSAVNHEGSHVFDFRRIWNAADVVDVHATAVKTRAEFAGANLWSVQQQLADGSALRLQIGWLLPAIPASTVQIEGPGGTLYVELSEGKGTFNDGADPEQLDITPMVQAWDRQLDAFARAVDTGEVIGATVENGLAALADAQACAAAARRR